MMLKNHKIMINKILVDKARSSFEFLYTNTSGVLSQIYPYRLFTTTYKNIEDGVAGNEYYSFLFGNGTTPTVEDMYDLESRIDMSNLLLESSYVSADLSPKDGVPIRSIIAIYKNNGNTDITIKEIGLTISEVAGTGVIKSFLLEREVLQNEIVIRSGENYSFTFLLSL